MAEEQKKVAAKEAPAANESASEPSTFTHDYLIQNGPAIFGVAPFVVAGALAKANKKLTVDDAQVAVNTFLGR